MTVCVAAIYNNNSILGASDRMVTGGYGDITFEPPVPKILYITNSIAVLTAGDQNIQMQVFQEASKLVGEKINADPSKWVNVSDVADIYSKCFYKLRNKLIEAHILSQYNLTLETFIDKSNTMSKELIDILTTSINRFVREFTRDQGIETIITGIDDYHAHIYVIINGEINCNDKLGFASIGIGSNHAISHFMLSKYSPGDPESKALLTIHQAKKKSEVSPGVGKETDMCVIGPLKGSFTMLQPIPNGKDIVKDLDKFYDEYREGIGVLNKKAEENIKDYLKNLAQPTQSIQEASPVVSILQPTPKSQKILQKRNKKS